MQKKKKKKIDKKDKSQSDAMIEPQVCRGTEKNMPDQVKDLVEEKHAEARRGTLAVSR